MADSQSAQESSKRIKSKTVRKKRKYSNIETNNQMIAMPVISTITNQSTLRKRKFDDGNNQNEAHSHRKKRKLNALLESNKLLKKENYELQEKISQLTKEKNDYKHEFNTYKNEANKWKTQIIKLCSQLQQISNDNLQKINSDNDKTINNMTLSSQSQPPPQNHSNNTIANKSDEFNNHSIHNRRYRSIFRVRKKPIANDTNQITLQHKVTKKKSRKELCIDSHSDIDEECVLQTTHSSKYAEFEDSYHVSVHCHICRQHFDVIDEYRNHLKTHYDNDPNKKWKECDLGCKRHTTFCHDADFMSHISQHLTDEKPFKCHVVVNGQKCQTSIGTKNNMKKHWERHWKKQKNADKTPITKPVKVKQFAHKPIKAKTCKQKNNTPKPTKVINKTHKKIHHDFENSYYVSINCHICKQHFDDICQYGQHIKQHYDNNALKTWLHCDFGCKDKTSRGCNDFITHIASHTKDYPYKCNIADVDNCKSQGYAGYSSKSTFKSHWNLHHNKTDYSSSDADASSYSYSSSQSGSECDAFFDLSV